MPRNAAETQRRKFKIFIARFRRAMLGFGRTARLRVGNRSAMKSAASTQPTSDPFPFHPIYVLKFRIGGAQNSS
jgi:hypothetical protein